MQHAISGSSAANPASQWFLVGAGLAISISILASNLEWLKTLLELQNGLVVLLHFEGLDGLVAAAERQLLLELEAHLDESALFRLAVRQELPVELEAAVVLKKEHNTDSSL